MQPVATVEHKNLERRHPVFEGEVTLDSLRIADREPRLYPRRTMHHVGPLRDIGATTA